MPSKPSSPIDKCKDLPLTIFIDIMCDGDHSRLGEGDTEAAWDAIRAEYDSLIGGASYSKTVSLLQEINYLAAKYDLITEVLNIMQRYYLPIFGEILAKYNLRYTWVGISEENYLQNIEHARSRIKTWVVKLRAKEKEWEELSSASDDAQVDREYFEDWLIGMSKDQGYHLKASDLTVFQFAILMKNYLKDQKKKIKSSLGR